MIEIVDAPHICDGSEKCDDHRADRWLAHLAEKGYPPSELKETYLALLSHIRYMAMASETVKMYQSVLMVAVQRQGPIKVGDEELLAIEGALYPSRDSEAGTTTFYLKELTKEAREYLLAHSEKDLVAGVPTLTDAEREELASLMKTEKPS